MKSVFLTLALISSIFLFGCAGNSDSDSDADTYSQHSSILPVDYQKKLKTGIDVDWAKTPTGRFWAQKSHDDGINVPQLYKERGFSHVRIRIKEDILDDTVFDQTGKSLLEEVKVLVEDCVKAGITPILAYQAAPFKDNPTSDAVLNDVVSWWERVAETF
ncbi:MAG: hypothetical protein DSZ29_07570, partial [Aquificaceae bacterium]